MKIETLENDTLRLTTPQVIQILKSLPPTTKFFECPEEQNGQTSYTKFLGERDTIITLFRHYTQNTDAPAWNGTDGTHTLWVLKIMMADWIYEGLSSDGSEYCVLLEYCIEDENEKLPVLQGKSIRSIINISNCVKRLPRWWKQLNPAEFRSRGAFCSLEDEEIEIGYNAGSSWAQKDAREDYLSNLQRLCNSLATDSEFLTEWSLCDRENDLLHMYQKIGTAVLLGPDAECDPNSGMDLWRSKVDENNLSCHWLKGFCVGALEHFESTLKIR